VQEKHSTNIKNMGRDQQAVDCTKKRGTCKVCPRKELPTHLAAIAATPHMGPAECHAPHRCSSTCTQSQSMIIDTEENTSTNRGGGCKVTTGQYANNTGEALCDSGCHETVTHSE